MGPGTRGWTAVQCTQVRAHTRGFTRAPRGALGADCCCSDRPPPPHISTDGGQDGGHGGRQKAAPASFGDGQERADSAPQTLSALGMPRERRGATQLERCRDPITSHSSTGGWGDTAVLCHPPPHRLQAELLLDLCFWRSSSIHPLPPPFPLLPHTEPTMRPLPPLLAPHVCHCPTPAAAPHPSSGPPASPPPRSSCRAQRWALQHRGHNSMEKHFLSIPEHGGSSVLKP